MRAHEFISEDRKPLRKSVKQSMPNLTSSDQLDNNNQPYLAYRFGVALAPSPDCADVYEKGPIGSNFTMIDYTDEEAHIREVAAKRMGIAFQKGTGKGSAELEKVINKVSPVAASKRNKYGV